MSVALPLMTKSMCLSHITRIPSFSAATEILSTCRRCQQVPRGGGSLRSLTRFAAMAALAEDSLR